MKDILEQEIGEVGDRFINFGSEHLNFWELRKIDSQNLPAENMYAHLLDIRQAHRGLYPMITPPHYIIRFPEDFGTEVGNIIKLDKNHVVESLETDTLLMHLGD